MKLWMALLTCAVMALSGPALAQDQDQNAPMPPEQPERGPGGSADLYASTESRLVGDGLTGSVIYTPKGIVAGQTTLPVVIFLHGWGAIDPKPYGAWINHIVKRGNIVIYPLMQTSLETPPSTMTDNALVAIEGAFATLRKSGPYTDPVKLAIVGHAMGGVVAVNLASKLVDASLPSPIAILSVAPGKTQTATQDTLIPLSNMDNLPKNLLLITMAGDADERVGDHDARRIILESDKLAPAQKIMLMVHSDNHGSPALEANHMAAAAPNDDVEMAQAEKVSDDTIDSDSAQKLHALRGQTARANTQMRPRRPRGGGDRRDLNRDAIDAQTKVDPKLGYTDSLDWYAYWKTFDLLTDAGFEKKDMSTLTTNPALTDMGQWSDGTPVAPMEIIQPTAK